MHDTISVQNNRGISNGNGDVSYINGHDRNNFSAEFPNLDDVIEQALEDPGIDIDKGIPFPNAPAHNIDFSPSSDLKQQRHNNLSLNKSDEDFIRASMNSLHIQPPPWASSISENNWQNELRKRLSKSPTK